MPSARTRQRHTHQWTAFEHHALLCLICRQIPITGLPRTPTPTTTSASTPLPPTSAKPMANTTTSSQHTRFRGGKRRKTASAAAVIELSKSLRHAHRDVADALNRALNFANQERDIPVEEVSAMIAQLMEERPLAVAYLERQRTNRVTRSMRRVWERAGMVSGCRRGGGDSGGGGGGVTGAGGDAASASGVAGCGGDRGLDSTDVGGGEDEDDPWGDNATTSLIETQPDPWGDDAATSLVEIEPDPWGEEVAAYLNETQQDPWGDDEAVGTAVESRAAAKARSPIQADTTMFDTEDDIDLWGSHDTAIQDNDPADPWADTITPSAGNSTNPSTDPCADLSSQLASPSSPALNSNSSSQAQSTASASITTAPQTSRFTGLNSERLAMLESTAERQDETVEEPITTMMHNIARGKGGNAVELPFNRLELSMMSGKRDAEMANESTLDAGNDESDVSEEE